MSDFVPPEIVTEILKRLPVKSLSRFTCVCKRWYSLISNPYFSSKHLSDPSSLSSSKSILLQLLDAHNKDVYDLYDKDDKTPRPTKICFPFYHMPEYLHVFGSCNGILCFSDNFPGLRIILCNPSIRRAVVTPVSQYTYKLGWCYKVLLGFGFVAKTNDYKIVRVTYEYNANDIDLELPLRVEVFSLSSNTWTVVEPPMFVSKVRYFITQRFWSQAVVGTVVHWVARKQSDKKGQDLELCENLIMRFDLESERFVGDLGLPKALALEQCLNATVLKGLGLLSLLKLRVSGEVVTNCSVWVMTDYDNVGSWTQLYNVVFERRIGKVLVIKGEGGELILSDSHGKLFTYNCENGKFTSMGLHGKYIFFVNEYVEILLLLGKGENVG